MGSIAQHSPGDVVDIQITRNNKLYNYNVTLKNQNNTTALVKAEDSFYNDMLGVSLQKVNNSELDKLGLNNGLKIIEIDDGILRRGGISEGFIITEINGIDIGSRNALTRALQSGRNKYVRLKGVYPNGTRVSFEFML